MELTGPTNTRIPTWRSVANSTGCRVMEIRFSPCTAVSAPTEQTARWSTFKRTIKRNWPKQICLSTNFEFRTFQLLTSQRRSQVLHVIFLIGIKHNIKQLYSCIPRRGKSRASQKGKFIVTQSTTIQVTVQFSTKNLMKRSQKNILGIRFTV